MYNSINTSIDYHIKAVESSHNELKLGIKKEKVLKTESGFVPTEVLFSSLK